MLHGLNGIYLKEKKLVDVVFLSGENRGSSLDSHRLILFAGKQGLDKQHNLMEELMNGYFTQGKFIGDM